VVSGTRTIRADEMTVQQVPATSSSTGRRPAGTFGLKRSAGDGGCSKRPSMTATGQRGEYHDPDQKAT